MGVVCACECMWGRDYVCAMNVLDVDIKVNSPARATSSCQV